MATDLSAGHDGEVHKSRVEAIRDFRTEYGITEPHMQTAILLSFLFPIGHPDESISKKIQFGIRAESDRYICVTFRNMTQRKVTLQMPPEGSAFCDRYWLLEAIDQSGKRIRQACRYAPAIPEYQVILNHRSIYEHRIQPVAYLGDFGTGLSSIRWLRVTYRNPLTKKQLRSQWLELNRPQSTSTLRPTRTRPNASR